MDIMQSEIKAAPKCPEDFVTRGGPGTGYNPSGEPISPAEVNAITEHRLISGI